MSDKQDREEGALDTTVSAVSMAGTGAAIGAAVGAGPWGAAIGGVIGAVGGMGVGLAKHLVGKNAPKPGPAGEARAQQALLRANVESLGDSMTPTDLSVLASRELAELDSSLGDVMTLNTNPNIPSTTLLAVENQATAGLRSLMIQQQAVRGVSEIQASRAQADRKLQALGNLANIAAKNSQLIQEAEAMAMAMRQASIGRIGAAVGAGAKAVVTGLKINSGEEEGEKENAK